MGMRYLQLNHSYTGSSDGSAVLHVSQLPPNAALFVPGPALMFVVSPPVAFMPVSWLTPTTETGS